MAKSKLNWILKSKSTSVTPVQIGDLVQESSILKNKKREKWSYPKPVRSYYKKWGSVTVPGQNDRKISTAVEDVRFAITDNELALKCQEENDVMNMALHESIDSPSEVPVNESIDS